MAALLVIGLWVSLGIGTISSQAATSTSILPFEPELQAYETSPSQDAVARLAKRIEKGEVQLQREGGSGYLLPLLRELKIPVDSQLLVYSKTSLQRYHISSHTPRAIYHHQQTYVAWIPTAPMIEMLAFDAKLGTVLYTLNQTNQGPPVLVRENRCLECHISPKTLNIPGALVRSFRTTAAGDVDLLSGSAVINHTTPYEERWGGWYVTGLNGQLIHRTSVTPSGADPPVETELSLTPSEETFTQHPYPKRTSDVVSMLVFEHEAHMQNLLTRLAYESRAVERTHGEWKTLHPLGELVLRYLLFTDEAPLPPMATKRGAFAEWFESQGVKDKQGRSLWELDLQTRLFRYPCSFLIHSESFHQLPREVKNHLYRRLWLVLSGEDTSEPFKKLTPTSRNAIRSLLTETLTDLPSYWNL